MNALVNFGVRGAQFLFGIIILGLSVDLLRGHKWGDDLPTTFVFSCFVAGITLVGCFIGIAATFFEPLQGIIGAAIDGVVALINLAGGVLISIKLKGQNCGDTSLLNRSELNKVNIINGGCRDDEGCLYGHQDKLGKLNGRCKENQADSAFMFMTTILLTASAVLLIMKKR